MFNSSFSIDSFLVPFCVILLHTYYVRRTVAQVMLTLSVNGVVNAAAGVGAAAGAHASRKINPPPALFSLFTSLGPFGIFALVVAIGGLVTTLTLVPDWGDLSGRRSSGVEIQNTATNSDGTRSPSLSPALLFDFVDVTQSETAPPTAPSPSTSTSGVGSLNPANSPSGGEEVWSTLPPSLQSDQFPTSSGPQNTDGGPLLIAISPSLSGSESSSQPSVMSESAESAHSASPSVNSSRVNTITTPPVGTDEIDSDNAGSNTPIPSMMDVLGPDSSPEDDTNGLESVQPTPLFLEGNSDLNPTSSSTTSMSGNPTSLGGHPPSVLSVDLSMAVEKTDLPREEVTSLPSSVADVLLEGSDPTQGPVPSGTNDPSMPSNMFPNALSGFPTEAVVSSSSGIPTPTITPGEPIDATSSPHADDTFSPQALGPAESNDITKYPATAVPNEPSPSPGGTRSDGTSAPAKANDSTTQVPSISSQVSDPPSAPVDSSSLQIETTASGGSSPGPTPNPTNASSSGPMVSHVRMTERYRYICM